MHCFFQRPQRRIAAQSSLLVGLMLDGEDAQCQSKAIQVSYDTWVYVHAFTMRERQESD